MDSSVYCEADHQVADTTDGVQESKRNWLNLAVIEEETPYPNWEVEYRQDNATVIISTSTQSRVCYMASKYDNDTARFIANSPKIIKKMIAEIKMLRNLIQNTEKRGNSQLGNKGLKTVDKQHLDKLERLYLATKQRDQTLEIAAELRKQDNNDEKSLQLLGEFRTSEYAINEILHDLLDEESTALDC